MFFSRSRVIHSNTFVPKMNNIPIEHKHVAKFLGVLVDDKLTWKHHITAIKSKMSRYVGIMYRLRQTIPLTARLTIYNSLVHSHLNYCSLVWGASCKSNIDTLFTTQKKAVRGVMPGLVNYYFKDGALPTHTKQAFSKYNILTVHNIVLNNMLLYIYKVVKICPLPCQYWSNRPLHMTFLPPAQRSTLWATGIWPITPSPLTNQFFLKPHFYIITSCLTIWRTTQLKIFVI